MILTIAHRQSLTRFLSIYEERRDYAKLFGTLVMVFGLVLVATVVLYVAVFALRGFLSHGIVGNSRTMGLVLLTFSLGAFEAIDDILEGTFAVFSRPRSIFIRKYLLVPGLQLALACALAIGHFGVYGLGAGFVVIAAFAAILYAFMLRSMLRKRHLLDEFRISRLSMPFREVFGFGVPLITTQLVFLSINSVSVILLEQQKGTAAVATLRVIMPLAQMNQLVIFTFTLLFMPFAARLYARGDSKGMREAYWHTAVWLTVLSFPVFAVTVPLAHSVTVTLYGPRYADSGILLALISLGLYWNAALGFNALTLQTFGRLRYIVAVNVGCLVVNIVANILLIERYGALGVAIATAATVFLQNALNQVGLHKIGIPAFELKYARPYVSVAVGAGALWAMERLIAPPLVIGLVAAAGVTLAVFGVNRSLLRVGDAFPELTRIPVFGAWLR
jgi:O-antigen/teichoic acid export membrane protein